MRATTIFLLGALGASCGAEDGYTVSGSEPYGGEDVVRFAISFTLGQFGADESVLDGFEVRFADRCWIDGTSVLGYYARSWDNYPFFAVEDEAQKEICVVHRPVLCHTALVHELGHAAIAGDTPVQDIDWGHPEAWFGGGYLVDATLDTLCQAMGDPEKSRITGIRISVRTK